MPLYLYKKLNSSKLLTYHFLSLLFFIFFLHAYADHSSIYYNRHLRVVFIEDLVLFDVDSRLKDCGKDDPEPSA